MNVEIFTLCEAATERQGQLCILHTFSNMLTPQLPAIIGGLIVCQLRCRQHEDGFYTLKYVLVDSDGAERWCSELIKLFVDMKNAQTTAVINITPMIGVEVFGGQHELRLLVNMQEFAAIPLAILRTPKQ